MSQFNPSIEDAGEPATLYTFYLERPDEENEIGIYPTFEEAKKSAEDGGFMQFTIAEIRFVNPKTFKSAYVEVQA